MPVPPLIADLLRTEENSNPPGAVELVQTHISYVLLAGEYVYKIKKPLNLGFLDYSTLDRRRHLCEEEVRLNRRLCDGVYVGVVPVTLGADGRHQIGGSGEPIEFAVQMRRVANDRMMPALLASGGLERGHLSSLAAKIAEFHRESESSERIAGFGRLPAVFANWEENFAQAEADVERTMTRQQFGAVHSYVDRFLLEHGDLIEERADQGRVRNGHGDLRADSVVFAPDGSVCIMDCIEFNERLRYGDVASDAAFLVMDLEARGYRCQADEFVSLYLASMAADETFTAVLNFYRVYRAFIRGKVDSILADEREVPESERAKAVGRATRYFALAAAWAQTLFPQQLIVMSGLSGTGKSFIGRAVAARVNAVALSTDVIRRELTAGPTAGASSTLYGEGMYTAEERKRVYDEMFRKARHHLDRRRSVLLDGTFLTREQRSAARQVAREAGVPLLLVQVTAPEQVVRARLDARATGGGTSDARWATYLAQRERFDALDDVAAADLVTLDSTAPLDHLVDRICERSRGRRP